MIRHLRRCVPALFGAALLTACGTDATRPDARIPDGRARVAGLVTCTAPTLTQLLQLAADAFGSGSPNYNSVAGKINNMDQQLQNGNTAVAKERAFDIVAFTLTKEKEKGLPGTAAQLTAFVNGVLCFAGIPIETTDAGNSTLIFPSDPEQVVYDANRTVGIKFPAGPVNAPTLVVIQHLQSAPLITKLDQYPGFVNITATAETPNPFAGIPNFEAIVGVCATAPSFLFANGRLRLGHQSPTNGFEITPKKVPAAEGIALSCDASAAANATTSSDLIPDDDGLVLRGGGVGGTVKEFSPFAPLDEELTLRGGGVGGTVKEFDLFEDVNADMIAAENASCSTYSAPIGSLASCRPAVRVMTFQRLLSISRGETVPKGHVFESVPIDWLVLSGNGAIATNTAVGCGSTFASIASTTTGPLGSASVCWKLGNTPGTNTLRASARIGGEVPAGVSFDDSGIEVFTATATPPTQLAFLSAPSSSQTAGTAFSATVEVRDANGERVYGYNGAVTLTLNQHTFANGATTATVSAVEGVASFSLTINKAATGYTLAASASFGGSALSGVTSSAFTVVAAAPASMTIVQGDNQTAATGATLPINPTVIVKDAYANPVGGVGITWTATLSSGGSASPGSNTTNAAGVASTAWTVGEGANELRAGVTGSDPEIAVYFSATGTTTLSAVNVCEPGGAKDPINDPSKPFAFYIPNPGPNKSYRSIQLYLSASGKANRPSTYRIELSTQMGTFDEAVSPPVRTIVDVVLRGSASENSPVTWTFATPIAGVGGGNRPNVMVRLRVLNNPDNATVNFNTGPCSLGSKCKVPPSCNATEVSSPTPYPLGTFHRNSVALVVKGT